MTALIRTIVAGVGSVEGEDPTLAAAVALAGETGATLHLVHAFDLPDPVLSAYATYSLEVAPDYYRDHVRRLEVQLGEQAARHGDASAIRCHVREGLPGRTLVRVAEEVGTELVVVGATRRGKLLAGVLGSTAEEVLRRSHVPVLVLRRPLARPVRRVLLATDLSAGSGALHERAVEAAEWLAGAEEPELRVLTVASYGPSLSPVLREGELGSMAEAQLRRFLEERQPRGRRVEPRVRVGDAAREIVAEAAEWGAELVVVGTHGRTGIARLLVGSTAAAVLRAAERNVLVVPLAGTARAADAGAELVEAAPSRGAERNHGAPPRGTGRRSGAEE